MAEPRFPWGPARGEMAARAVALIDSVFVERLRFAACLACFERFEEHAFGLFAFYALASWWHCVAPIQQPLRPDRVEGAGWE